MEEEKNESNIILRSGGEVALTSEILPALDFDALNKFYRDVEILVKGAFKKGYHYGPAYEQKPGKDAPPNILYKKGAQFFIDRCGLMFEDKFDMYEELNKHTTYKCKTRMFLIGNPSFISSGEGTCSTAEGRFSYMSKDKIIPYQVREQASLRAHKDAIERFFNLSRFFDTETPQSQEPHEKEKKSPGSNNNNGRSEAPKKENPQPKPEEKKETPPKDKPIPEEKNLTDRKSIKFDWDPSPEDLNNENWFIKQIALCRDQKEVTDFMDEFEFERKFFSDNIQSIIYEAASKKYKDLKGS